MKSNEESEFVMVPAGTRTWKLIVPDQTLPLDAVDEPGAVYRATMILRHMKRLAEQEPDRPLVPLAVAKGCPVLNGALDLWHAGLIRMVAWRDVQTGVEGLAVTLLEPGQLGQRYGTAAE